MKTLKRLVIALFAITIMTTVFGQPVTKKNSKGSLRDKINHGAVIQKSLTSGDYSFSKLDLPLNYIILCLILFISEWVWGDWCQVP
jgi:hypothetical protein